MYVFYCTFVYLMNNKQTFDGRIKKLQLLTKKNLLDYILIESTIDYFNCNSERINLLQGFIISFYTFYNISAANESITILFYLKFILIKSIRDFHFFYFVYRFIVHF